MSFAHKASAALAVQAKQDHSMFGDKLRVSSTVFSMPAAAVQRHKAQAEAQGSFKDAGSQLGTDTIGAVRYSSCSAACMRALLATSLPLIAECKLDAMLLQMARLCMGRGRARI